MFNFFNIIIISTFSFIGFYRGLIKEISGLLIFIVAVVSSLHLAIPIDFIISKSLPFPLFSTILSHFIVFATVLTTAKLFFLKTIIQNIRFLSTGADGILGAIFGSIKGLFCSLLIFSCLYISGAANFLSIEKTWFYSLNRSLYKKVAMFVTSGEIATLGEVKNVQNGDSIDSSDDAVSLNEVHDENIENLKEYEEDSKIESENPKNTDSILSVVYNGVKYFDNFDQKIISETLSSLSTEKISDIFKECCIDAEEKRKNLNFNNDEMAVYVSSLIMNAYKKNTKSMTKQNDTLSKKIEYILADIINDKKIQKEERDYVENAKRDKPSKILSQDVIAPSPVRDERRVVVNKNNEAILVRQQKSNVKDSLQKNIKESAPIKNEKKEVENVVKNENVLKKNPNTRKSNKIPVPKRKIESDSFVKKDEEKKENIAKKTIDIKNSNPIDDKKTDESEDVRDDINSLIEDSIR